MRGTPLIAPLRQLGTKQRWTALWRSALFSSTRLRSKNLMSGCTCRPFIPVCTGSGSGMQNPLANFIGVFSLVRDVRGFQVNPLCRHDITRSDRQIGNWSNYNSFHYFQIDTSRKNLQWNKSGLVFIRISSLEASLCVCVCVCVCVCARVRVCVCACVRASESDKMGASYTSSQVERETSEI